MNRALWLLLGLQLRGWLRFLGKNLRTVRGALLALIGAGVFVPWMLTALLLPTAGGIETAKLGQFGPAILLLYCVANVLFSPHERAIHFSPAEVQFLFTGPFSRRQILAYKIFLTLLVSVPMSLLMAMVFRVRQGWWPGVLIGLALVSIFMQLFSMVLGLISSTVGEHLFSRGRWLVGLAVAGAVAFVFIQFGGYASADALAAQAERVFGSTAWHVLMWPLQSFFDVMRAQRLWPDLVQPLAVALGFLACLAAFLFLLDAHYLEASAASSGRLYARLQRMRGRQVTVEEPTRPRIVRLEVPALPYWGGIGPIFWRQLTTAMRGMGRFMLVMLLLATVLVGPILGAGIDDPDAILYVLVGVAVWLSIFLTTLVPFDFRGDIDRMAALKSLPIVPWRLAVGQLLTPTLLLSGLQWLAVLVCAVVAPEQWLLLLAFAVYIPAFCFMLVALENLLFLLFPVRIMAATPGDFQAIGRNVLLTVGKLVGLTVTLAAAGLVGGVASFLSGRAWVGVAAAWPVVALIGVTLVPLVSLAFQWFDVGRDTPA